MSDGVEATRCDRGNVASCPWCICRRQGAELLRLRAVLEVIAGGFGAGATSMSADVAHAALEGLPARETGLCDIHECATCGSAWAPLRGPVCDAPLDVVEP